MATTIKAAMNIHAYIFCQSKFPFLWDECPEVQILGYTVDLLKKAMATHSSTLAWKIPWVEEPGRLQSMGSQRVRHD